MTETITAPANLRIETDRYGYKRIHLGDAFIGSVASVNTVDGRHTTAYGVRCAWIGHHYGEDIQAAIDAVVEAYGPAPHEAGEVHRETYRNVEFVVTFVPGEDNGHHDRYDLTYDGKRVTTPKGDLATIAKKVRGWIDQRHDDKALLPKLLPLVAALQSVKDFPGWDNGATPKVGDVAYVYAMGRYRRGLVTKVGRTRATVSYTTASSSGRVFHKDDKFTELAAEPVPARPATVIKDTSQLEHGDVVLDHGMRVLLNAERTVRDRDGETVYAFVGTVTNLDEVLAAGHVPASFLRTEKWVKGQGWVTDRNDVWVIQGNQFMTWAVEAR